MGPAPASSSEHPGEWKFGYAIYHAETRAQWRAWLEANHDSEPGVWLCSWKRATGRPACPYPEVVEETICFGWIDSTVNTLDVSRANGWWMIYDPVEDLLEPDDLAASLDEDPAARSAWNGFPPSARKQMLWWVISAVKPETRAQRIATVVVRAARGERAEG